MWVVSLVGLALVLTACGNGVRGQAASDHNHTDVAFLQGMVQHHERSLRMSGEVIGRVTSPEVKDLARRCEEELTPAIATMKEWLDDWHQPTRPQSSEHSAGHGAAHPGMLSDAAHDTLESASGPALEKLLLEGMVRHHKGAVEMAGDELESGRHPGAKKLAEDIRRTHQADMARMRQLLARLS